MESIAAQRRVRRAQIDDGAIPAEMEIDIFTDSDSDSSKNKHNYSTRKYSSWNARKDPQMASEDKVTMLFSRINRESESELEEWYKDSAVHSFIEDDAEEAILAASNAYDPEREYDDIRSVDGSDR